DAPAVARRPAPLEHQVVNGSAEGGPAGRGVVEGRHDLPANELVARGAGAREPGAERVGSACTARPKEEGNGGSQGRRGPPACETPVRSVVHWCRSRLGCRGPT